MDIQLYKQEEEGSQKSQNKRKFGIPAILTKSSGGHWTIEFVLEWVYALKFYKSVFIMTNTLAH